MRTRPLRSALAAAVLAVCGSTAAVASETIIFPRVFDDARLGTLLDRIREFDEATRHGLERSRAELLARLPALWHELQAFEGRLRRTLPTVRKQIEQMERELRRPPSLPPAPPTATLMA